MGRTNKFSFTRVLMPPVLALVLLAAAMAEATQRIKPKDADIQAFHLKAKAELESIPKVIQNGDTVWYGRDTGVPQSAVNLLNPNEIISREYVENRTGSPISRTAQLLIVQCGDARDMQGHYPPNCYPAQGWTLLASAARDWTLPDRQTDQGVVKGMRISGMEYKFSQSIGVDSNQEYVYNFFLIPGSPQTLRDINAVYKVGEDYQRRYFGAAEVQVLVSPDLTQADRDDVLVQLLGPYVDVLRFLQSGGIK
jgi:hypothetical protein